MTVSASSERASRAFGSSNLAASSLVATLAMTRCTRSSAAGRCASSMPSAASPRLHRAMDRSSATAATPVSAMRCISPCTTWPTACRYRARPVELGTNRVVRLARDAQHRRNGRRARFRRLESRGDAARRRRRQASASARASGRAGRALRELPLEVRRQHGPEESEQAGGLRAYQHGPCIYFLHLRAADQVQASTRARRGDISEPPKLERLAVGLELAHPALERVGRALALGAVCAARKHDAALAGSGRDRGPVEQRPVAAARVALQVGQDDHVELQALGAMDGHHLHAGILAADRRRHDALDCRLDLRHLRTAACHALEPVERAEEQFRVCEIRGIVNRRGTVEREPGRLQPAAERA